MTIITEKEGIEELTAIMREADVKFQTTGGSTRHYVRDLLLPMLQQKGLCFCKSTSEEGKNLTQEQKITQIQVLNMLLSTSIPVLYDSNSATQHPFTYLKPVFSQAEITTIKDKIMDLVKHL